MSDGNSDTGSLAGFRRGVELLAAAAGNKDVYDFTDHATAGLPMVVKCTGCTMTMVGAGALIDAQGRCWCDDCAEIQAGA